MSLPNERILFLLELYTSKTATVQQEQELMAWVQEAQEDSELKNYIQNLWSRYEPVTNPHPVDWDKMFEDVVQDQKVYSIASRPRRMYWPRIAAAAIIVLILSAGGYYYLNMAGSQDQVAKIEKQPRTEKDIPPGGNKALLTLADGSQILLDSAQDGMISQQGNTKIIKLGNGELSYKTSNEKPAEVVYNTITTPKGGQYQLVLADGSRVWLNSASSLKFPASFSGNERIVELVGEGYFEVAKNTAMPFQVRVNDMQVEVLGTHFNVNAYNDEPAVSTTLLEGSVRVAAHGSVVKLKPGEQAQRNDFGLSVVSDVDINTVMSWKTGFFEFDNLELSIIMRQISRWYDVDVKFAGNKSNEKYGGRISKNLSLFNILDMLETNGVKFKLEGKNLIVN